MKQIYKLKPIVKPEFVTVEKISTPEEMAKLISEVMNIEIDKIKFRCTHSAASTYGICETYGYKHYKFTANRKTIIECSFPEKFFVEPGKIRKVGLSDLSDYELVD